VLSTTLTVASCYTSRQHSNNWRVNKTELNSYQQLFFVSTSRGGNEVVIDKNFAVHLPKDGAFEAPWVGSQLCLNCWDDGNIIFWLPVSSGSDVSKSCPGCNSRFSPRYPKWQALSCHICRDESKNFSICH